MKNFVQNGNVITVTAPADIQSGDFVAVGALFGFAVNAADQYDTVPLATTGVYTAPVFSATNVDVGDIVYHDAMGFLTTDADDGAEPAVDHVRVGVAVTSALADASAIVDIKLD